MSQWFCSLICKLNLVICEVPSGTSKNLSYHEFANHLALNCMLVSEHAVDAIDGQRKETVSLGTWNISDTAFKEQIYSCS